MDDKQRAMSNQLERFQGLSETRWPLPAGVFCASGEDRKALSRYINEFLDEIERSDAALADRRAKTGTEPPKAWNAAPPPESGSGGDSNASPAAAGAGDAAAGRKLAMSRTEYIRRQNALFRELTGHRAWADVSGLEAARDAQNKPLMASLELYMAALDEKIYMSADHMRAMIGVRDQEVRNQYDAFMRRGEAGEPAKAEKETEKAEKEKAETKESGRIKSKETEKSEKTPATTANPATPATPAKTSMQMPLPMPQYPVLHDDNTDLPEGRSGRTLSRPSVRPNETLGERLARQIEELPGSPRVRAPPSPGRGPVAFADLVELRDMYQLLWFQHSDLAHQRDALELEMASLRYDHALQQAKVLRLQYATHSLGRKLVDAQHHRTDADALRAELEQARRENRELAAQNAALRSANETQADELRRFWRPEDAAEAKGRTVEAKIAKLFEVASTLRVAEAYTATASAGGASAGGATTSTTNTTSTSSTASANTTNTGAAAGSAGAGSASKGNKGNKGSDIASTASTGCATADSTGADSTDSLALLSQAVNLIDISKQDADRRLTATIEAFATQYRAREAELLAQHATALREKDIVLARCDKLEKENQATSQDLAYLEQRTLSLVLMLKSVRASIDPQGEMTNEPISLGE